MRAIKTIGLLALAGILGIVAITLFKIAPRLEGVAPSPIIATFEDCVAAGNPVMESYPRQCAAKDGRVFVEDVQMEDGTVPSGVQANGCAVAGCSGQLCVSADEAAGIVTTCEFRAEYACYKESSCEPQADGKCGWTQTASLKQCLANPPKDDTSVHLEVM